MDTTTVHPTHPIAQATSIGEPVSASLKAVLSVVASQRSGEEHTPNTNPGNDERFLGDDTSLQPEFARSARLYLDGAGALMHPLEERQAIARACVLAEESPAVAVYLDSLGPNAWERFTPNDAAKVEELAREERAPGGAVDATDFFSYQWPTPRALVGGWLGEGSLGMLYAYRGRGKTWLAYDLALAIALGSQGGDFLGWDISGEGRPVLYVDGEMRPGEIRERFSGLLQGRDCALPTGRLRLLSRMAGPNEPGALLASLSTPEGRAQVERAAKGCALVILDNARTLGLGGAEENESSQWLAAQEWLLSLKRLGCAVLFVHHAGKGGQQRGTSAREDACDYVLGLHPPELSPGEERTQGARAVVRFEKSRGATLAELGARDARLLPGERGGVVWGWEPVEERQAQPKLAKGDCIDYAKLNEYRRLLAEGLTIRAAAEAVGVAKTTLIRWNKSVPQKGAPSVPSVGRSVVPCSAPLKGGAEQGTRNSPEPSACSGGPEQQRTTGTHLENSGLEPVSLFRSDHAAEHPRAKSASPLTPTSPHHEERFSSPPSANTEQSTSPQPQPPRAYPRRGGPIPPGLVAPIVLFTPKGPGAGGRS